jgi:periplasmic divalent cation tolerance protein
MSDHRFIELFLTCGSWQEAQGIVDVLLEKKLIACAEFLDVKSRYWWEQHIEEAKEVKLIMQTITDNFSKIEAEIAKLHSYKTFVLNAVPIAQISENAGLWVEETVRG